MGLDIVSKLQDEQRMMVCPKEDRNRPSDGFPIASAV
jgi:hypothetical protein